MGRKRGSGVNRRASFSTLAVVFVIALAFIALNRLGILELPEEQGVSSLASQAIPASAEGKTQVFFLDVGQGDSELIRIPGESGYFNVLLDTGEYEYAEGLIQYLQELGIERIDLLIESHPHTDHMGCMARIVQRFEIGSIYMPLLPEEQTPTTKAYEKLLDAVMEKNLIVNELYAGAFLEGLEDASFEVLAPRKDEVWEDVNNYSAVIRFTYGEDTFLFPGDAESPSEKEILKAGYDVSADVLKCGHHGSRTSTSAKFLKAVNPSYAVISCGAENSYGHPHDGTLQKLEKLGVEILRTDEDGTVLIASGGHGLELWTGLNSVEAKY